MSAFLFAIMAAIVIIVALVWTSFRRWLGRQFRLIVALIGHFFPAAITWATRVLGVVARYVGIYSFILSITVVVALVLMGIAILIGIPWLTGLIFAFCLGLIILAWLPAGLIMKLFRVANGVVPNWLKTIIGVAAFIGFVGVSFPEVMTFVTLVSLILIGFIFAAGTRKTNIIDRIIIPITILMIAVVTWKYVSPEGFRSSIRYISSLSKVFSTVKDRGSIINETEAATTYAIALKDISVLYNLDAVDDIKFIEEKISKGDTLRLVSHIDEVIIIDGQGLLRVQLRNKKGTFLNGPIYWVEAEFVQITSPRKLMSVKEDNSGSSENKALFSDYASLEEGVSVFPLEPGEETPWFGFKQGLIAKYFISSPNFDYKILVSDGSQYEGKEKSDIGVKKNCYYKIKANSRQVVTVMVEYLEE